MLNFKRGLYCTSYPMTLLSCLSKCVMLDNTVFEQQGKWLENKVTTACTTPRIYISQFCQVCSCLLLPHAASMSCNFPSTSQMNVKKYRITIHLFISYLTEIDWSDCECYSSDHNIQLLVLSFRDYFCLRNQNRDAQYCFFVNQLLWFFFCSQNNQSNTWTS